MTVETAGRIYLENNSKITLSRKKDGSQPEEFVVRSVLGEGGFTVCYEAERMRDGYSETGKLKEFYPVDAVSGGKSWYYSLERLEGGRLVPCAGTIRKFDEMCEEYIGSYRLLMQTVTANPDNEILKNYIQHGEILYGYGDRKAPTGGVSDIFNRVTEAVQQTPQRPGTVYVWTPGIMGRGFNEYLADVRRYPGKKPAQKVGDILDVVSALTDCVRAMHRAGLLHLDIKPSNFLVPLDSSQRINAANVSLFDINTLCSVRGSMPKAAGSEGYTAPEVYRGKADNRSDIYSIGAMLFNALVISDDIPDGLYRTEYFWNLRALIEESPLFAGTCQDQAFTGRILTILSKCLAENPKSRYQSCTELKKDLDLAVKRLDILRNTPAGEDKSGSTDPMAVIQKMLYDHPIYKHAEGGDYNVLVLGSGDYTQLFADACMQVCQIPGVELKVTLVSDRAEEEHTDYLKTRPGMTGFVDVDGEFTGAPHKPLASLSFVSLKSIAGEEVFYKSDEEKNAEIIRSVLDGGRYCYVFISLGSDQTNLSAAGQVADALNGSGTVCCITEKHRRVSAKEAPVWPIWVNEPITVDTIDRNLDRMAFNTHLCWKSSSTVNIDMEAALKEFTGDLYSYTSSVAMALSVKYKLHSMHIDTDDLNEAAKDFKKQVLDLRNEDTGRAKFESLVAMEHRRWLLVRLAEGWTAPRRKDGSMDLDACVARGSVKDQAAKKHPCIVFGSDTMGLNGEGYSGTDKSKWDDGSIDPALDGLDRLSVQLHRVFKKAAEERKADIVKTFDDLNYIRSLIPVDAPDHEVMLRAHKQLRFALINILNGVESFSRQKDYFFDVFRESAAGLSDGVRTLIEERLKIIDSRFFPQVEANLYRNYKANDMAMIERLPFIMTYRYRPSMAVAFEDGKFSGSRCSDIFGNVASATILSPSEIYYLYSFDDASDAARLTDRLDAALNYLNRRKVRCRVSFLMAYDIHVADETMNDFRERMKNVAEKYSSSYAGLAEVKLMGVDYEGYEDDVTKDVCNALTGYLKECGVSLYDGSNQLFGFKVQDAALMDCIHAAGIPDFELDQKRKRFKPSGKCSYLGYITDDSFLRIRDMFALMNSEDEEYNQPEMAEDYKELWKLYSGEYLDAEDKWRSGVSAWNRLCECLEKRDRTANTRSYFILSHAVGEQVHKMYFMPEYTFASLSSLVTELKQYGIFGEGSHVDAYTSDTCRLDVYFDRGFEDIVENLINEPRIFMEYYSVGAFAYRFGTEDCIGIRVNDMNVRDVDLDPYNAQWYEGSVRLLAALKKKGFIRKLDCTVKDDRPVASFMYTSPRIKEVLTNAGAFLEIYAYYKALETGYFDDVSRSFQFQWEDRDVRNELDLIMTRGFRSMVVECKAVAELNQDYYHKLSSLADKFCVAPVKVLLANTYMDDAPNLNEKNAVQRVRGDLYTISTISSKEDIENIGETLVRMMQNAK